MCCVIAEGFKEAGLHSELGVFKKQGNSLIGFLNQFFFLEVKRNRTNIAIGEDTAVTPVGQVGRIFDQFLNLHSTLPLLRQDFRVVLFVLVFLSLQKVLVGGL